MLCTEGKEKSKILCTDLQHTQSSRTFSKPYGKPRGVAVFTNNRILEVEMEFIHFLVLRSMGVELWKTLCVKNILIT